MADKEMGGDRGDSYCEYERLSILGMYTWWLVTINVLVYDDDVDSCHL